MTGNRLTVGPTSGRGWQVSGRDQTFRTQALAIQAAKQDLLSRGGGELLVKGRGGRVREQRTIRRHRPDAVESAGLLRRPQPPTHHPAVLGQESAPIDDAISVPRHGRRASGHRRVLRLSLLLAVVVVILVAVTASRDGEVPTEDPSAFPATTLSASPSTGETPGVAGSLSYGGTGSSDKPPVRLAAGQYRATATVSATGAACRFSATIESVEGPLVSEELRVDVTVPGARMANSQDMTLRAAPYVVRVSASGCRWTLTIEPRRTTP